MKTTRSTQGRTLFCTRDSGGMHETTPGQYVTWAKQEALKRGLSFDGTPEAIYIMIETGQHHLGDIFLDYDVCGNIMSRDGLNALIREVVNDPTVSHVMIPRRDRLARPDDPLDGMKLEALLRSNGITLVFMGLELPPIKKGQRQDLGELIMSLIDYEQSGKERRVLADKILYAQLQLAQLGFSVGGRPPYGFRRWLARIDGTAVRELAEGERVRMPGHHVVWLPGPEAELAVIRRILEMLQTKAASRVASILTEEKIPTPDHGRMRTDGGFKHATSGIWSQSTIIGIARNPLLSAVACYGRRSMGDQARFSPSGPRNMEEGDYLPNGRPKVIRNADEALIRQKVAVPFEPVVAPEQQQQLLSVLDARAGTQRGKPRARTIDRNPLGCRIYDLNCTWSMYRQPYKDSFRYLCGYYQQSHGQQCAHNCIDGPQAVRFLLGCLRQKVLSPRMLAKVEERLQKYAREEQRTSRVDNQLAGYKAQLNAASIQLERINRNLAMAETREQFSAISALQKDLQKQYDALKGEVSRREVSQPSNNRHQTEIEAALALLYRLSDLAADENNYGSLGELFNQVNARLFLRFEPVQVKKRTLNRLTSGVVTFGSATPPIQPYEGPTGRRMIQGPAAGDAAGAGVTTIPNESGGPAREESLGNVNRGERI